MNNTIKNSSFVVMGLMLMGLNSANAAIGFGEDKVTGGLKGSEQPLDVVVQSLVTNVMLFLSLLVVLYLLWGGINILTAAGEEEKIKKGKAIIIQAIIGLVIIFIASSIVKWVLGLFVGA